MTITTTKAVRASNYQLRQPYIDALDMVSPYADKADCVEETFGTYFDYDDYEYRQTY